MLIAKITWEVSENLLKEVDFGLHSYLIKINNINYYSIREDYSRKKEFVVYGLKINDEITIKKVYHDIRIPMENVDIDVKWRQI